MSLSSGAKLIILLVLCVVLYFIVKHASTEKMENIGNQHLSNDPNEFVDHDSTYESVSHDALSEESYRKKMTSPHAAKAGEKREAHHAAGNRGGDSAELDKFFEGNHPHDNKGGEAGNDNNFAAYLPGSGGEKLSDKDKFNPTSLLPQEKNGDWFDDPHESTSVTSPHLINIYRPIGITTNYSSLKNPSHDIRGTIANPKQDVSPWLNSSYEPDTNIRNQSLIA